MLGYIARRLVAVIPVMAVVAVVVFLMLRLTTGDPAAIIAGDSATAQDVDAIRSRLGLDRPIVQQFAIWIFDVVRGDLGESFFFKKPVARLIVDRLEPTVSLAVCTLLLAVGTATLDRNPVRTRDSATVVNTGSAGRGPCTPGPRRG